MVGTRKLARLLDHAAAARAKIVLVGDPRQLPEIDAGGAFAGLARRVGDAALADNRRQTDRWERDALAALRSGDAGGALAAYTAHGRVHDSDDPLGRLIADWWVARAAGDEALMVAPRLREVDDLNRRARILLRLHRQIGDDGVELAGRGFAVGDSVLALRNDYRVGILNGTTGTITAIDHRRRSLSIRCELARVEVPFDYAEAGYLTHGYATTLHKAQGATVDRTFVLVDETYAREHLYTALSRGRRSNDLYVAGSDDERDDVRHAPELTARGPDTLSRSAARSAGHQLAVDHAHDRLTPMAALEAERRSIVHALANGPDDPQRELRDVKEEIRRHQAARADALRRKDLATSGFNELGPIRRRVHRAQRTELSTRLENATRDVARADAAIAALAARANELTAALPGYRRWHDEHLPEIARLRELNLAIHDRRIEAVVARGVERGRDFGIEL